MTPSYKASRSWSIYDAADSCPLDAFLKCQEAGDLSSLIISGRPPVPDLQAAFLRIYSQFCAISEDNEALARFTMLAQIAALETRIEAIRTLCTAWEREPHSAITEALEAWGYYLPVASATEQERAMAVKMIRAELKRDEVDLTVLLAERERQEKTDRENAGHQSNLPASVLLDKVLIELSDAAGYALRGSDMTVQQYALRRLAMKKKPAKND